MTEQRNTPHWTPSWTQAKLRITTRNACRRPE